MTTRHILTEDEIRTLLHSADRRQPIEAANKPQPLSVSRQPEAPQGPNGSADQVLSTIQAELRQIRSLMATRTNLGLSRASSSSPLKYRLLERLTSLGFQTLACEKLLQGLTLAADETTAWQQIVLSLETQLPIARDSLLDHKGIVAFVGPTGSGKTTTIAKLATKFIQRHTNHDIGLITTDYYSVGGRDQLCTYGRILDIPVHRVNTPADLTEALSHLSGKRLILIDTPGLSHLDPQFSQKLSLVVQPERTIKTILTLPATTHEKLLDEIFTAFNYAQLSGVSLTKIDEAPFIGHVLSTCIDHQLPIFALTNGQQVQTHLIIPTLEKVLSYAFTERETPLRPGSLQPGSTRQRNLSEELAC